MHEPPESPLVAAARGPHAAGLASLTISGPEDRSLALDVWYPAEPGDARGRPSAPHTMSQPHEAVVEPAPLPGEHPLLLLSHGNAGLKQQSTFLTTHLASWGFVVAAPDHTGNTIAEMFGIDDEQERIDIHKRARRTRPGDLIASLDAVVEGGPWGRIDAARVGAIGHSFGGWTALKMPRADARISAVCGLAPAAEPFVGKRAFEPDELPLDRDVPALLVAGLDDVLVDWEASVLPLFARLGERRALVAVDRADHFHFCDGVEPLHGMHAATSRPRQTRLARPYTDLLSQSQIHRILRGLVAHFAIHSVARANADATSLAGLDGEAVTLLDPHCSRFDPATLRERSA